MKKLVTLLVLVMLVSLTTTSCATTSKGCGYAKAQKYNKKQSKKYHRYKKKSSNHRSFTNF